MAAKKPQGYLGISNAFQARSRDLWGSCAHVQQAVKSMVGIEESGNESVAFMARVQDTFLLEERVGYRDLIRGFLQLAQGAPCTR